MNFLSLILSFIVSLVTLFFPNYSTEQAVRVIPRTKIATPSSQLIGSPSAKSTASPSARVKVPLQTTKPIPWGTTEKIGEHLYRTYVANEGRMGTPDEILTALNEYRRDHGRGELSSDEKLCGFAQRRAGEQNKAATLDSHKGFGDYLDDPAHWRELGVTGIGENSSYGYVLSGQHLIEWVFDSDEEHRNNQLNSDWNLSCAGVSGVVVNIIFGKRQ